jgi:threonine dehydratase
MPENASLSKEVDAAKSYNGVKIAFYGRDCADTEIYAIQQSKEQGMIWIA